MPTDPLDTTAHYTAKLAIPLDARTEAIRVKVEAAGALLGLFDLPPGTDEVRVRAVRVGKAYEVEFFWNEEAVLTDTEPQP